MSLPNFFSWANSLISAPTVSAGEVSTSNSQLPAVRNLDPFDCNILPTQDGARAQCQALKIKYADAVKPDCSRLPVNYQPFCRALQPEASSYNPNVWPNTADTSVLAASSMAVGDDSLALARQRCTATSTMPREFYTCLWSSTKYPAYPEFQVPNMMITRDNCPCKFCAPRSQIPGPGQIIKMWMP